MERRHLKALAKGLAFIVGFAALGLAARFLGLDHVLDEAWIDSEVRGHGLYGAALFTGLGALIMGLGLPRQFVCFLGGYAFGFWSGAGLSLLASALGCVLAFSYARFLGRGHLSGRLGRRVRRADEAFSAAPLTMTMVIRFLPVGSNLLTNLLAGLSSAPMGSFVAGSAIGYVPQTVIFALLGSGFKVDPAWRIALSVVLFLLSTWLGVALYRRHKKAAALAAATENGEETD
ncbi:MAG: VTT domain-containing protein [Thermodesulfobacteriota bacterium]